MALMVFQSLGIPTEAIKSILTTIQNLKFILCTGYDNLKGFAGGNMGFSRFAFKKGMCQGNGVSPAAWTVISILPIISAHKNKGHGAHLIAPISGSTCHLAGGLFVDNTNLFHVNMCKVKTISEAHEHLQEGVINWQKLLLTTGSALKPAKYFSYFFLFQWKADRTWMIKPTELNPDLSLGVQMLDGSLEEIKHLLISTAIKMLGSMTCPSGSSLATLERMKV